MRIVFVGTGYVGLVAGTCLAEVGNAVTCVDVDESRIQKLRKGEAPLYEPGLEQKIRENLERKTLTFTTNLEEAISLARAIFITVGTAMGSDGKPELSDLFSAASRIGDLIQGEQMVVVKSTVPVGTTEKVRGIIMERLRVRNSTAEPGIAFNPEFLKEGTAIDDFVQPDRIVIGAEEQSTFATMREIYRPFFLSHDRFYEMDIRSAEMTKYAANSMLATRISFINEIANICEAVGADVNMVRKGIGSDNRIGFKYLYPGCGFGGSCLPKDLKALELMALENGYTPKIVQAVQEMNHSQKRALIGKIEKRFGGDVHARTFTVWGLSFKPETDDVREASAIVLIGELLARGAKVNAYDPKAMANAKTLFAELGYEVTLFHDKYAALLGSDALLLTTEWKEFRNPDFERMASLMASKLIFDGRNQYDVRRLGEMGFECHQIGVKALDAAARSPSPRGCS